MNNSLDRCCWGSSSALGRRAAKGAYDRFVRQVVRRAEPALNLALRKLPCHVQPALTQRTRHSGTNRLNNRSMGRRGIRTSWPSHRGQLCITDLHIAGGRVSRSPTRSGSRRGMIAVSDEAYIDTPTPALRR